MDNKLDYEYVFRTLVALTASYLNRNNLRTMVLGISGGIDSTVVAAIANEVSKENEINFIGRSLPIKNKNDEFSVSKLVGKAFCDDFRTCYLEDSYNKMLENIVSFEEGVDEFGNPLESKKQTPIANGNIQARLRMIYLYNLASINRGIVLSTDNQTEYQLGFWTLHGDVGDFNPLFGLWKHEVYELAEWLLTYYAKNSEEDKYNAIKESIKLTPTDGLGISNSDLEQIGAKSYSDVDDIFVNTVNVLTNQDTWTYLYNKYGKEVVEKVWKRHISSTFKRQNLPIVIERRMYEKR